MGEAALIDLHLAYGADRPVQGPSLGEFELHPNRLQSLGAQRHDVLCGGWWLFSRVLCVSSCSGTGTRLAGLVASCRGRLCGHASWRQEKQCVPRWFDHW